jgi:hypothetical protein
MGNNYMNLFLDAQISDRGDQESYGRRLDTVLAQEHLGLADIVGIGERGTGSTLDLYVVHRQGVVLACERGIFNKRIEIERVGPIAPIARLRSTQEGYKGTDVTITSHDAQGAVLFRILWGLGGPDWVEPMIMRQREHLFGVLSDAMDKLAESPRRQSVAAQDSKSQALMTWATDVVTAAGVEATPERIEEHANMIAAVIRMFVFLPLARVDDLNMLFPTGSMPAGQPIETFDDLYRSVVARVRNAATVDRGIDEYLAAAWNEYVRGCHETYAV